MSITHRTDPWEPEPAKKKYKPHSVPRRKSIFTKDLERTRRERREATAAKLIDIRKGPQG